MSEVDFEYASWYCKIFQNYGENSWTHILTCSQFFRIPKNSKEVDRGMSDFFEGPSIEVNTIEAVFWSFDPSVTFVWGDLCSNRNCLPYKL